MQLDITISGTVRTATALLFAAGVVHKLWNPGQFQRTVAQYLQGLGLGGRGLDRVAAVSVVALELAVIAACLFVAPGGPAAILASTTLLGYGAAMAMNLYRGNDLLDCGCHWGAQRQPVRPALVVRNVMLAALAATISLPVADRNLLTIDVVSIVLATLAAALLYTAANHMLAVTTPAGRSHR